MTNHTIVLAMTALAALVVVAIAISVPFRAKKLLAQAGSLLLPLPDAGRKKVALIFVCCACVIAVVPFRNYAPYLSAVFLLCALLGAKIAAQQAVASGHAGIYENLILADSAAIFYGDIYSLPTLAYENDPDTTMVDRKTLKIMRNKGSDITLIFETAAERERALAQILEHAPHLKNG